MEMATDDLFSLESSFSQQVTGLYAVYAVCMKNALRPAHSYCCDLILLHTRSSPNNNNLGVGDWIESSH